LRIRSLSSFRRESSPTTRRCWRSFRRVFSSCSSCRGSGRKKIKALWEKLGVTTLAELELACRDGRISELQGFGKKTCVNLLASIESRSKYAGRFRLGDIAADAERMLAELREHPDVIQVSVAGSYRRRKEIVGDLDFIVATNAPENVSSFFVPARDGGACDGERRTKSSVASNQAFRPTCAW
jgi:DNA polymerase (family 10)